MLPPKSQTQAQFARQFETPWMIQQVETHLICGPLARRFPAGYAIAVGVIAVFLYSVFREQPPNWPNIGHSADQLLLISGALFLMLRLTRRQQAILVWMSAKGVIGFVGMLFILVGTPLAALNVPGHGWAVPILGLIWLPGLEFLPRITPYQKYLTIARILLTIPCIPLGYRTGDWS